MSFDDQKTLLILLAIFIILIILVILTIIQLTDKNIQYVPRIEKLDNTQIEREREREIPEHALYGSPGIIQSFNPTNSDIISEYDYRKLYDPLVEPTRRIPRYEIPPFYMKRQIDIPTRGYPDNFTQFGILIEENKRDKQDRSYDNDNKILRLFGRQEFPGSNDMNIILQLIVGLIKLKFL